MLSFPHLVVLFVIALVIFGPQKLPELARMLGKATAEFRKMTNDFRYALEDEVRELDRQTRIREEDIATAARATQPEPSPPEGAVQRPSFADSLVASHLAGETPANPIPGPESGPESAPESGIVPVEPQPVVTAPDEKPTDDHTAV
jgi:sec-independent protein translocase protein TatB